MRLNRLTAQNIYSHLDFNHAIGPVTIFVGRNEAGKSTRVGLLELLLNGPSGPNYPLLGTSPGYRWMASGAWDDGTVVTREMAAGTHALTFNGSRSGGLKATQSRIVDHLGRASVWSIGEFFKLTPEKRLAFLEADVLKGAGWTLDVTQERVTEALRWSASGLTWADVIAMAVRDEVDERTGRPVSVPFDWASAADGRTALSRLTEALKNNESAANSEALRLGAAVKVDEETVAASDLPMGTVAAWEASRVAIDEELGNLREHRGKLVGEEEQRKVLRATIAAAEADLDAHRARDFDAAVTAADEAVTGCQLGLTKANKVLDDAVKDEANAQVVASNAVAEHNANVTRRLAETVALQEATANAGGLTAVRTMLADWSNELLELATTLPSHLAEKLTIIAGRPQAAEQAVGERVGVLQENVQQLDQDVTRSDQVAVLRQRALASRRDVVTACRSDVAAAEKRLSEAVAAHRQAVASRRESAATEASIVDNIDTTREKLVALGTGDLSGTDQAIESATARRAAAQKNIDRLNDDAGARAARLNRRALLLDAQERRTRLRDVMVLLAPVFQTMLVETVGPFAGPIDVLTKRILNADFVSNLSGGFTWSLKRAGRDIGPGSRSANVVALLAMRLSVLSTLGGWRCLSLDDLENLGADRRRAFLEALVEETAAGRLDNFIGGWMLDAYAPIDVPDGVTIIDLNQHQ